MKRQAWNADTILHTIINDGWVVLILFLFATLPAGILGHIPAWGLIKYLFVTVFSIFLPGWVILNKLNIPLKDGVSHIFLSFAIGFALNVLLYAILLLLNIQVYSAYFVYGEALVSIVVYMIWFINQKYSDSAVCGNTKDVLKITLMFLFMLVLEFVLYQMPQRSALFNGYQYYYQDLLFWQKVCIASSKGYPIPELSISGCDMSWHVFSCFYIALMNFCTGIDYYDLCFSLSYLWQMFLLVGAVYIFLNEILQNRKLIFMGCFILLFVGGFEKQFGFYYLAHLYQCKLGVTEGCAFSLLSFVFIIKAIIQEVNIPKRLLCFAILFFAVACGAKIPYACILMVGIGFILVFSCKKSNWLSHIFFLCCFMGVFILVAKLFVFSDALMSDSSNGKLTLSAYGTVFGIPIIHELFQYLSNYIGPLLSWGIVVFMSIIGINHVVVCGFFFTQIVAIYKKQLKNIMLWALSLMVWAGIFIYVFIDHSGRSQGYFIMAAFPFAVLFSLYVFENIEFKLKRFGLYVINILVAVSLIGTMCFAPKVLCNQGKYCSQNITYSKEGNDITQEEMIALYWIRDNLPDNVILATNKVLAPNAKRSFVTSAFSERQIFIEGYEYSIMAYSNIVTDRINLLSRYYSGETEAKTMLMNEGVTHAVLFKAFNSPNNKLGNILYENKAMAVYELRDN